MMENPHFLKYVNPLTMLCLSIVQGFHLTPLLFNVCESKTITFKSLTSICTKHVGLVELTTASDTAIVLKAKVLAKKIL